MILKNYIKVREVEKLLKESCSIDNRYTDIMFQLLLSEFEKNKSEYLATNTKFSTEQIFHFSVVKFLKDALDYNVLFEIGLTESTFIKLYDLHISKVFESYTPKGTQEERIKNITYTEKQNISDFRGFMFSVSKSAHILWKEQKIVISKYDERN